MKLVGGRTRTRSKVRDRHQQPQPSMSCFCLVPLSGVSGQMISCLKHHRRREQSDSDRMSVVSFSPETENTGSLQVNKVWTPQATCTSTTTMMRSPWTRTARPVHQVNARTHAHTHSHTLTHTHLLKLPVAAVFQSRLRHTLS